MEMAKKAAASGDTGGKVKASAAIRQYMKEHKGASAKEVAEAVSKVVGRTINPNYIYVIRAKKAEKKAIKRRGRPPKSETIVASLDGLTEAARLLKACGNDEAKAMATIKQVVSVLKAIG
jgi:hypothetical protein